MNMDESIFIYIFFLFLCLTWYSDSHSSTKKIEKIFDDQWKIENQWFLASHTTNKEKENEEKTMFISTICMKKESKNLPSAP